MLNLKLKIEYDGTHYHGWQVQNGIKARKSYHSHRTIQNTLELALKKILQEDAQLIVAGRTDAGVHALAQIANFKTNTKLSLTRLRWALNCLLPEDIKVSQIQKVALNFNSRFCAKSKVYRYTVLNRKYSAALLAKKVYFFHYPLNIKLMRQEAKVLLGRHNFSAFAAKDSRERNPLRSIKSLKIIKKGAFIHFDIQADSFLYNMVRSIVGTLLEIGRGHFEKGRMLRILKLQERRLAGPTVPAHGLYLLKVSY